MPGSSAVFNIIFGAKTDQLEKAMGGVQRRLGGLQKNLNQAGRSLTVGLTAPLTAIGASSFKVAADFEASMARVKAVSGATGSEFQSLEQLALDLGKSTVFTASEVASLEEEFAKLGFSTKEIQDATEATLFLAQATGSDLATASSVAGNTLRAFGLEADQTQRVADVMANSFSGTALSMDTFADSMKFVAPVAKSAGLSVEQTTALLGTLSNAGIKGSSAGTALRRIISELGSTSEGVGPAIARLAKEGLNLADAKDEVGRNAQSALLVLAEGVDTTAELTDAFMDAEGSAKDMADTMNDTAAGSLKRMGSAIEGAQISLGKALAPTVEAVANKVAKLAERFSNLGAGTQKTIAAIGGIAAALGPVSLGLGKLVGGIKNSIKALKALRLAIISNPIGALATALTVVGVAAIGFISTMDNMTEEQREQLKATREQNLELAALAGNMKRVLNLDVNEGSIKELRDGLQLINEELDAFNTRKAAGVEVKFAEGGGPTTLNFGDSLEGLNPETQKRLKDQLQGQLNILVGDAVRAGNFGEQAEAFIEERITQRIASTVTAYRDGLIAKRDELQTALDEATAELEGDATVTVNPKASEELTDVQKIAAALDQSLTKISTLEIVTGDQLTAQQDMAKAFETARDAAAALGDDELASFYEEQAAMARHCAEEVERLNRAQQTQIINGKKITGTRELLTFLDDYGTKTKEAANETNKYAQSLGQAAAGALNNIASTLRSSNAEFADSAAGLREALHNNEITLEEYNDKLAELEQQRRIDQRRAVQNTIAGALAEATAYAVAAAIKDSAKAGPGAIFLAPIAGAAAAAMIQSLFSASIPAFAEGGAVLGPTLAMLGDNPSGRELVVPFEKLPQFIGMLGRDKTEGRLEVGGRIRGRDIFLSANQSQGFARRNVAALIQ